MSTTLRHTRLFVPAGAIMFAAAAATAQAAPPTTAQAPTPHTVTCGDGTTGNSAVKSPCGGHGGVKKNAKPKPAPVPSTEAASAAVAGTTKISSPRDPASPTKIYDPAAGGIGNTAVEKGAPVNKTTGGVGNTAVMKEGQANKAASGIGRTEEAKMAPAGGIGQTEVKKGETAVKCKDGTYSTAEHAKDRCVGSGGVATPGASKPTPTPP